jgi:zinc protease
MLHRPFLPTSVLAFCLAISLSGAMHAKPNSGSDSTTAKKPIKTATSAPTSRTSASQTAAKATAHRALAASSATSPPAPRPLGLQIQKATLDNGLRVVMNVDHTSPTIAVAVTYDVGARNEERGRSGFAHLFEHMMFQGSANVAKGEHFNLVSAHGGTLNGTTSSERTNYFEMLPANELALALWLEADRMKSLNVDAENFENQRKVVQEEYRMRVSNAPYEPARIRLGELAFQGYWPYEHDTIGSMQDLDNAQLDWVRSFHDTYYAPNLAVLSIAGDFEPDEAMVLVHRFFDTAKRQQNVVPYSPPPFPDQAAPRIATLDDPHAKTPAFFYGWVGPPAREPDHYALELAVAVLTDGESSRLHQKLVRDKALAQDVAGWTEDHRGPDLITIQVKLAEDARLQDVQKALDAQIEALAKDGPTDAEMTKVRNRVEAAFLFGLQSNLHRARIAGEFELFWGDARLINVEPIRYLAVTKEDIARVTSRYLVASRRTLVEARPAGVPDAPPAHKTAAVPRNPPAAAGRAAPSRPAERGAKVTRGSSLGKEREGGRHKPRHKKEGL